MIDHAQKVSVTFYDTDRKNRCFPPRIKVNSDLFLDFCNFHHDTKNIMKVNVHPANQPDS